MPHQHVIQNACLFACIPFCYRSDMRIPAKHKHLRTGTLTDCMSIPPVAMGMTSLSGSNPE